jgi:predicted ATPase
MADLLRERYRLERKISSKGSFGDVWLATDTFLDRPVALKCPRATDDPIRRERILVEARMLARLNHPHITQIYDAFFDEDEDNLYLVIEFVDGKDLSDIIGAGTPLPLDIVLEIALGILEALSYAHQQGLVHRDIKAANVMIGDDVKLTDFGLATLRSILQKGAGFMAGTPAYMAPEQIEGRAIDGRADLYALGVLLFEMITGGRLPFEYTDQTEMLDAHLHANPPLVSQFAPAVPSQLEELVSRLLAKAPEDRFPSAEAVMEALQAVQVAPAVGNLPLQLTPFVGREEEVAQIQERLRDPACRLLTLVGLGGSGKTRLALEAAAPQIDHYPHGVYFVSLAPLDSVDSIVPTIAEALGFRFYEEGEPQQQLLDYLRQKRMLILLDNFEHLVEGAGLVTDILQTAPEVKILVTSRVRLNVSGEHLFPVAGMHFPERESDEDVDRYSAIRLFIQSASRVRVSFEAMADDMLDIARICRLVEGMPLAILLATAWLEMLTPAEIVAEMRQSLDFLETDLRDVPARQRSMRAVFDHTWDLLTEREQELFAGLSVFRGGFTREAAREVSGASLRDLMALVHKSLLYRTANGRYDVHDLIRQYAAEKLRESPVASQAARSRHSVYFTAALQRWAADLSGPRQQTAWAEMDIEIENARRAWDWAVERAPAERLDQGIVALARFYGWWRGWQEGEAVCRRAEEKLISRGFDSPQASDDELRVLAQVLSVRSNINWGLGHPQPCSQWLGRSLALLEEAGLDDPKTWSGKAYTLLEMGHVASDSDQVEARRFYEQSLTLFRASEDRWGAALALFELGQVATNQGAYAKARRFHEESLAIRRVLGDQRTLAASLAGLGIIAMHQGELEEAERLLGESIAIYREIGIRGAIAGGLTSLGATLIFLGKFAQASSLLQESVAVYDELGSRRGLALSTIELSHAKVHSGEYGQARVQGQLGLALSREIGDRWGIGVSFWVLGFVALAEEAYAEAQQFLQESIATFRERGQRDELGSVLGFLGMALCGLDQLSQARQHICEALRIASEIRSFAASMSVIRAMALLLAARGDSEQAVELYALVARYPTVSNSRLSEDVVGKHISAVAAGLPPEAVAAAQERGRVRDLEATVAELLAELEC